MVRDPSTPELIAQDDTKDNMDPKHNNKQKPVEPKKEEPKIEVKDHQHDHTKELEDIKKSAEEFKNKYLRALADYQNLEKRVREEKMTNREDVTFQLLLRLLPFLDNLEQAEVFIKDKGLEMVRKQYYQALEEIGIKEIEVLGKEFDPHIAEAIDIVEGEKDNIMVEVLRKGYRYGEKVLRPAQVKVSKKK